MKRRLDVFKDFLKDYVWKKENPVTQTAKRRLQMGVSKNEALNLNWFN